MNPDVVAAVDELVRKGVLDPKTAMHLRRVASGSLISVREELRVLLWAGVFLVTTGVGALVRQHLDRIGPVAVAIAIGVAALACLGWAWRHASAPSFADSDRLLIEALICGVVFLGIGKTLDAARIKPNFEPAAAWLGWILIVGALTMRLGVEDGRMVVATALVGCGAVLAWFSWDERSIGRYALGVAAAAVGVGGWAAEAIERVGGGENAFLALVVLLAGAVIVLLLRAHRALRGSA